MTIDYERAGEVHWSDLNLSGDLEFLRDVARRAVDSGAADAASVRNHDGTLLYRYPRTLRCA